FALVTATHAEPMQQRSFYDRNGSFAGSSSTHGNSTSVYDKSGRFDGSVIRNSDGTTSFYDKSGHFTGSSTNTTQPKGEIFHEKGPLSRSCCAVPDNRGGARD